MLILRIYSTLNPDHVNDPLVYAATGSGSIKVHQVLLENGMDVNKYLELEGSPLVSACEAGNFELVRFLLAQGADPNNGYFMDYEALIWAIVGSHASLEIVKLLLGHGTLVKGTGALIAAAENGNLVSTSRSISYSFLTVQHCTKHSSSICSNRSAI